MPINEEELASTLAALTLDQADGKLTHAEAIQAAERYRTAAALERIAEYIERIADALHFDIEDEQDDAGFTAILENALRKERGEQSQ